MNRSPLLKLAVLLLTVGAPLWQRGTAAQQLETSLVLSGTVRQGGEISPLVPLASALVPGSGHLLIGRRRGVVYLAAETVLLTWHLHSAATGRRERDAYRDLAFTVARAPFMPTVRDTAFEYFEHMADFIASGPFDTDPGPELAPPTDEATFNGSVWGLARRTFFRDVSDPPPPGSPEYEQALDFYRVRAVGPNFTWSWENDLSARERFRRSIVASDDAFRRSTVLLGFVVVNHLISALDAHITRRLSSDARVVESRTALELDEGWPAGPRFTWWLRVSF